MSNTVFTTEVLLLKPDNNRSSTASPPNKTFENFQALQSHVCSNVKTVDQFHLFISRDSVKERLHTAIYWIPQVRAIYVYAEDHVNHKNNDIGFVDTLKKCRFIPERQLETVIANVVNTLADSSKASADKNKVVELVTMYEQQLAAKRASPSEYGGPQAKRRTTAQEQKYLVDIGRNHPRDLCSNCKLFIREANQLQCGHHICGGCTNTEKNVILCLRCEQLSLKELIFRDRDFTEELHKREVNCLECAWIGSLTQYQEHSERAHGAVTNWTAATSVGGANRPSNNETSSHPVYAVSSSEHQSGLDESKRIDRRFLYDAIASFLQQAQEARGASYNGTLDWVISDIEEKFDDAISERQKSMYSPPFYSAPEGYKMCLRIYLNGDADARGTHLSLFLVIMRGEHDNKLQWPFSAKITYTLLDRTTSNGSGGVTRELWSTHPSGCFDYPKSMMNSGYGVKCFVCLKYLEQWWHSYVKDNDLWIRVKIDLLSPRPEILAASQMGDSSNDDEHVGEIHQELRL